VRTITAGTAPITSSVISGKYYRPKNGKNILIDEFRDIGAIP
jgi:predicted AlkP superfamily pyrophosphatase or phosphodiesterase